ncbi:MAG: metal-dependent hydrolase [Firmicutes bacterium]|nr:metal-dependent hydrolase [Bacillota bacterium]
MLWRTHFLGGVITGYLISEPSNALAAMTIGGISALLPDIDSPYSYVGSRLLPTAWALKLTVGHRGIFHSILAAAVIALLLMIVPQDLLLKQVMFVVVFIGYLSHILLDSLSGGTYLLYPVPIKFSVSIIKTGGIIEKLVVVPVLLFFAAWFFIKTVVSLLC